MRSQNNCRDSWAVPLNMLEKIKAPIFYKRQIKQYQLNFLVSQTRLGFQNVDTSAHT